MCLGSCYDDVRLRLALPALKTIYRKLDVWNDAAGIAVVFHRDSGSIRLNLLVDEDKLWNDVFIPLRDDTFMPLWHNTFYSTAVLLDHSTHFASSGRLAFRC